MSLICAIKSVEIKQKAPVSDGRGFFRLVVLCCHAGAIAGKPAPTGLVAYAKFVLDTIHCGSWLASDEACAGASNHQGYLRLSGAGGKYWYNQVSLNVRSLVRINNRSSTGSTLSLVGYQSNRIR
jgi:hypothetical protein